VFLAVLRLCREAGLVRLGLVALDVSCPRLSWTPLCPRSPPW
jgi:hypothetical protein